MSYMCVLSVFGNKSVLWKLYTNSTIRAAYINICSIYTFPQQHPFQGKNITAEAFDIVADKLRNLEFDFGHDDTVRYDPGQELPDGAQGAPASESSGSGANSAEPLALMHDPNHPTEAPTHIVLWKCVLIEAMSS